MKIYKTNHIYETHIKTIDDEHQLMLVQIEELYCLLNQTAPKGQVLECCNRLFQTLRDHYDHEEKMMLKYFFPDTEGHIGQHMIFLDMVGKMVQLIRVDDYDTALSTLKFMVSWKSNHINGADKKYAEFMKTKPA